MNAQFHSSDSWKAVRRLHEEIGRHVIGYDHQTEMMLLCVLSGGHILAVGDPGTGKTFSMKVLAHMCGADVRGKGTTVPGGATYGRIDMVPDLMPSDIEGSEIRDKDGNSRFNYGFLRPELVFGHCDEINRTPPRTQSSLLSAMEERRVNAAGLSYNLHPLFTALATRNPIDTEGTYPLPAAQCDRFAVELDYGRLAPELQLRVLEARAMKRHDLADVPNDVLTVDGLIKAQGEMQELVKLTPELYRYVNDVTVATRPEVTDELKNVVVTPASPRAAMTLVRLAQARAYLHGRTHATADDVRFALPDVLRHRLILAPIATIQGWNAMRVVDAVLKCVKIPN